MSSNYRLKFVLIFFLLSTLLNAKILLDKEERNTLLREAIYVSTALDYELNNGFEEAAILYELAFKTVPNVEYLKKSITLYKEIKNIKKVQELSLAHYNSFENSKELLLQEYVVSSLQLNEYEIALKYAKTLTLEYNNADNTSLIADIYYDMKDYTKAVRYYKKSYELKEKSITILSISGIMFTYLNQKTEALKVLEKHYSKHSCNRQVCSKLFAYYERNNNQAKMLEILKELYNNHKNEYSDKSFKLLEIVLVSILENKSKEDAILFLEENKIYNETLYTLYKQVYSLDVVFEKITTIYKNTKDDSILGEIAILEYELAKDKNEVIKSVFKKFEKSIKLKDNANHENYYGYLLLEYDQDVSKALKLIKNAVSKYPNNYAFLDSLAWAYYKNNMCTKAYTHMDKIVKEIGLENKEIKEHWNKIKGCKSK